MSERWEESKVIKGQPQKYCANLIEQDNLTAMIRFVHPSVKSFLEAHFRPSQYQTSSFTGRAYLEQYSFDTVGSGYFRDVCFKYLTMHDFGLQVALRSTIRTEFSKAEILDKTLQDGNKMTQWTRRYLKMRNPRLVADGTLERPRKPTGNMNEGPSTTQKYLLLAYVQDYWPTHIRSLQPTDPAWPTFVSIAKAMNSSYRLHPWTKPNMSSAQLEQALFIYAVENNNMPILWLLEKEMKPKPLKSLTEMLINEEGSVACHLTTDTELLQWLIKIGGTNQLILKDSKGNNSLHFSAASGNVPILEILILHLANLDLLTSRNNRGETPMIIAAQTGQTMFLARGLQAINLDIDLRTADEETISMLRSFVKRNVMYLQHTLQKVLEYRPNAMGILSTMEPNIKSLVTALLHDPNQVSWDELIFLALDDDILIFFELCLDSGIVHQANSSLMRSLLIFRACTISKTTKPERVQIIKLLLEHIPEEIITHTVGEKDNDEKFNIITPLSLAMSRVAESKVAVDIVSILSTQLAELSYQGKFVPPMIREIGRPSHGELDYLDLLQKIDSNSVYALLLSGALRLQKHFVHLPKNNLLHIAVMQETDALISAIYYFFLHERDTSLLYSLTALSSTGKTALSLAIEETNVTDKSRHTHYILALISLCLDFDNEPFVRRCKNGPFFVGRLGQLLVETFTTLLQVLRIVRIQNWPNETADLAETLYHRVISSDAYLRSWGFDFRLPVGILVSSSPRIKEHPEKQSWQHHLNKTKQFLDQQELDRSGTATGTPQIQGIEEEGLDLPIETRLDGSIDGNVEPELGIDEELSDTAEQPNGSNSMLPPTFEALPRYSESPPAESNQMQSIFVDPNTGNDASEEWETLLIPGSWID
jgi:hypothetical protein